MKWFVDIFQHCAFESPSSRGRGLKYPNVKTETFGYSVALFTRAWIEIAKFDLTGFVPLVALFTRAWIEMVNVCKSNFADPCRPLHEGVD